VASALHVEEDTIAKLAHGKRPVTARLTLRVARLVEVGVDDLLAGRHLSSTPSDRAARGSTRRSAMSRCPAFGRISDERPNSGRSPDSLDRDLAVLAVA